MIEIKDLHKHYDTAQGRVEVLKGIDLSVPEGSITAVVGPSGGQANRPCPIGISLLEKPSGGQILVDGKDLGALSGRALRAERRAIISIFQIPALLSRLSVAENVAPLRNLVVHHEMQQRGGPLLDRVGLLEKANAYPGSFRRL